jgi:hypothetical protein
MYIGEYTHHHDPDNICMPTGAFMPQYFREKKGRRENGGQIMQERLCVVT